MTTPSPQTQSAKIYVFPIRERVAAHATPAQRFAAMEAEARMAATNAAGSGWYHDEAIRDEPAPH